jgi:TetR/AcrR family transcriptional regulator, cholesterol catabolism regulator
MQSEKKIYSKREKATHKKIMTYASQQFFHRGFSSVTVEELCKGLKIGKATFYRHFSNREELVEKVMAEVWNEVEPVIWENLNSNKPVDNIFYTNFKLQIDMLNTKLSARLLADIQRHLPELWERYYTTFREKETAALKELLARGLAEGVIRTDLDPNLLRKFIHALTEFIATPNFMVSYDLTPRELKQVLHFLIQSLRANE